MVKMCALGARYIVKLNLNLMNYAQRSFGVGGASMYRKDLIPQKAVVECKGTPLLNLRVNVAERVVVEVYIPPPIKVF
jgi:hypothetical protein